MMIQQDFTKLTAGCGHATIVRLSLDAERATTEIIQIISNPCIPCFKASRLPTRNILWADVNRGRSGR